MAAVKVQFHPRHAAHESGSRYAVRTEWLNVNEFRRIRQGTANEKDGEHVVVTVHAGLFPASITTIFVPGKVRDLLDAISKALKVGCCEMKQPTPPPPATPEAESENGDDENGDGNGNGDGGDSQSVEGR